MRGPLAGDARAASLLSGLQRLQEVGFRLWVDGGPDLLVRIRRARGGVVAVEFSVGELPPVERERAVSAIRRTVGRASVLCIGFVVDRSGATAGTDWDGVVIEGSAYLDSWPDAVAVREEIAAGHPQLTVMDAVTISPWKVFGSAVPSLWAAEGHGGGGGGEEWSGMSGADDIIGRMSDHHLRTRMPGAPAATAAPAPEAPAPARPPHSGPPRPRSRSTPASGPWASWSSGWRPTPPARTPRCGSAGAGTPSGTSASPRTGTATPSPSPTAPSTPTWPSSPSSPPWSAGSPR